MAQNLASKSPENVDINHLNGVQVADGSNPSTPTKPPSPVITRLQTHENAGS